MVELLSEPHHFCTRKTIGALRRQQPASLAPSANSKEPTHPHLDEHRARPAQAQCLSVPVSITLGGTLLPGRGRGYGRPRPVAVGGRSLLCGEEIIQSIHQHSLKLPEVKQEDSGSEVQGKGKSGRCSSSQTFTDYVVLDSVLCGIPYTLNE